MLGEERQNIILSYVDEKKSVSVQELMHILGASESTIRRDLAQLDREGRLTKVHGGAVSKKNNYRTMDDTIANRINMNREEKIAIAKYAASLIEPNDLVYLDAGTTTELMIDFINQQNVTFVTNAFSHARQLAMKGFTVYVLGGEFKAVTEAIVGEEAILGLDKYNFTKGFWGANGVTVKSGCSTPDIKEAALKKKAMDKTKEKYVLCDSSKFSQISSVSFAEFDSVGIITSRLEDNTYKQYKNIKEVER